jgi:hypothetical protein
MTVSVDKPIPDIPPALEIDDLATWCKELEIPFSTADAVIGKSPGVFKLYLNREKKMKHDDFVTLQNYLRIRAEALRKS